MAQVVYEGENRRTGMSRVRYFEDGGMAVMVDWAWRDGTSLPPVALGKWFYRWPDNSYVADTEKATLVFRGRGLEILPK